MNKNHSDEVIKQCLDILFKIAELEEKYCEINKVLTDIDKKTDFPTYINFISQTLQILFVGLIDRIIQEHTGCDELGSHMLYETGIIYDDKKKKYNIKNRKEFEDFIHLQCSYQ